MGHTAFMTDQRLDPQAARTSSLASDLRVVAGKLKRRLSEQAHLGDLTWSQSLVVSRLAREGPATVTVLAKAEGMRPQSMGANIASLEAAGLISGAPDPADRRQTLLSITSACRERIEAARTAREDWLFAAIEKNLTPEEQETLSRAVALLNRLVSP